MSYIDDNLVPGEEILFRARTHPAALIIPVFLLTILTYITSQIAEALVCLMGVVSFILLLRIAIYFFTTEFGLTNKRIVAKTGFIKRQSMEIMLSKVESITVNQAVMGRIFGFGTITVTGSGGTKQRFPMIGKPMELRQMVNKQINLAAA
jgi:uncharacterized membrane protein YdbT with pleckstrin-like domain